MRIRRCIHEILKDILVKLETKPMNKTKIIGDGYPNKLRQRIWKILIENDLIIEIENPNYPERKIGQKYTTTKKGIQFQKELKKIEEIIGNNRELEGNHECKVS